VTRIGWITLGFAALLCVLGVWALRRGPHPQVLPITQASESDTTHVEPTTSADVSTVEGVTTSVALPQEKVGTRQAIEGETVHVTGRVIFPPGTPVDEPVQLIAHATPDQSNTATIALREDGAFGATLPTSWHAIGLELHSRSLYCPEETWVYLDSGDQSVELRPELASRLEVRFILPRGVTDEELAQAEGQVSVDDGRFGISGFDSRTLCLARSRTVRFDSIPMTGNVTVRARIAPFCSCAPGTAYLVPGKCTQVDMQLERGAGVSGEVATETGQPVAGVEIFSFKGSLGAPDGGPVAMTDAQGHFQMAGLRSGQDYLMVMKHFGSVSRGIGGLNVSSLKAGGVCEGLRIVVKP
jgi:hypothetical protein